MTGKSPTSWSRSWQEVGKYLDLGLRFAISMALGLFGGYWLDKKLHTLPVFLILGMFFGAFSGFLTIYHAAFPAKRQNNEKSEAGRKLQNKAGNGNIQKSD
jgi:F0F1-type ATP synthase assembly protein I